LKITPLDIRRQEFSKKMRGIDPDEVETFLEMVADEYETAIRENTALKDRIRDLDAQVLTFRDMEKTLQDTIIAAQKAREEAKSEALQKADFIVREAELKAERWIEEARQEVMALRRELIILTGHKDSFMAKMRVLLNSQSELLNILEIDRTGLREEGSAPTQIAGKAENVFLPEEQSSMRPTPTEKPALHEDRPDTYHPAGSRPDEGLPRSHRWFSGGRKPQGESHGAPGERQG